VEEMLKKIKANGVV